MKKRARPRKTAETTKTSNRLAYDFSQSYEYFTYGQSLAIQADCFNWLKDAPENSIHGIITDPPYGVKEFEHEELEKMKNGKGGTWRIPPSFDGNQRSPLPRFTALTSTERKKLGDYFTEWSILVLRILRPGGYVFLASNAFMSQLTYSAIIAGGLEFRGELIRLVRTLRGGDRPKNAETEFEGVSSLPRGCYEPWGIFRKPLPKGFRVADCLRKYQTGGLRRQPDGNPFEDVVRSGRTPPEERRAAPHPSLKPQAFLRQLVYTVLPLGEGIILDPFMGSGSTLAASEAMGITAIGIERYKEYFELARQAVPKLKALKAGYVQHRLL